MVLPTPDYDSGWVGMSLVIPAPGATTSFSLTHNLGTTDLLVNIVTSFNNGTTVQPFVIINFENIWLLTTSEITITHSGCGTAYRVRLWKIQPTTHLKPSPPSVQP
ncbi:MAG: hypothetical protein ABSD92_04395 [Candidatus Bathyarchaeia archaeon]|jgi:hypothetical protein